MSAWSGVLAVTGGLAGFSIALGILWKIPPSRWLRQKIVADLTIWHARTTTEAVEIWASNGNHINRRLEELKQQAEKLKEGQDALLGTVMTHDLSDQAGFAAGAARDITIELKLDERADSVALKVEETAAMVKADLDSFREYQKVRNHDVIQGITKAMLSNDIMEKVLTGEISVRASSERTRADDAVTVSQQQIADLAEGVGPGELHDHLAKDDQ